MRLLPCFAQRSLVILEGDFFLSPAAISYHLWNVIMFCSISDTDYERSGSYDDVTDVITADGAQTT